jgi:hypothetical protein
MPKRHFTMPEPLFAMPPEMRARRGGLSMIRGKYPNQFSDEMMFRQTVAAQNNGTQAAQTNNSAMDAISALRDLLDVIDNAVKYHDVGLSKVGLEKVNRAKDVLKRHQ